MDKVQKRHQAEKEEEERHLSGIQNQVILTVELSYVRAKPTLYALCVGRTGQEACEGRGRG